jgi:hypothetical protein
LVCYDVKVASRDGQRYTAYNPAIKPRKSNVMDRRRENVPFDPYYFEKLLGEGVGYSIKDTFQKIYRANHWSGKDSVSGAGASSTQTQQIQTELSTLLKTLPVSIFLDLPCGDFNWIQLVDFSITNYIGADIVPELIHQNQEQYGQLNRNFMLLDITQDSLPPADLLFCRDCFVHLSFADIYQALANIKSSQLTHLLTTTFTECVVNEDVTTGDWRVLNLERPPFNFPPPLYLIDEQCSEGEGEFQDKSLGLWLVETIPTEEQG